MSAEDDKARTVIITLLSGKAPPEGASIGVGRWHPAIVELCYAYSAGGYPNVKRCWNYLVDQHPGIDMLLDGSVPPPKQHVALPQPEAERALWDATSLMREHFDPVRWVVPDLIPEGLVILAGKPKMGKSWLVLALALGVASGGYVLGSIKVDRSPVLYYALEDTPRRLKHRMDKLLRGGLVPDGLHFRISSPGLGSGAEEDIHSWLLQHKGSLVIIDTLARIRPSPVERANTQYEQDYKALQKLKALAAYHQCCIMLVHHQRKMASDDVYDTVLGSQGITGSVDGMMVLTRERGSYNGKLHVTGREIEKEVSKTLLWDAELATWRLTELVQSETSKERSSEDQLRDRVLYVMEQQHFAMDIGQVCDLLEETFPEIGATDPKLIATELSRLYMAGRIKRIGRGVYEFKET